MKQEVQKQQEQELEEEAKPADQQKNKKDKIVRTKPDPENDPVLKRALEWLKSDVAVKQYKLDNQKPAIPETAALDTK
jgi:hypothetical protein